MSNTVVTILIVVGAIYLVFDLGCSIYLLATRPFLRRMVWGYVKRFFGVFAFWRYQSKTQKRLSALELKVAELQDKIDDMNADKGECDDDCSCHDEDEDEDEDDEEDETNHCACCSVPVCSGCEFNEDAKDDKEVDESEENSGRETPALKYKVGDIVRIKTKEELTPMYSPMFANVIDSVAGRVLTISEVIENPGYYKVNESDYAIQDQDIDSWTF